MPDPTDRSTRWRLLWQPPSSITDTYRKGRSVGFLELFYDLVFVVVVAQLAHHVADHTSWSAYGWFVLLLTVMWLAWLQGSFYVDAHQTTDLSIRVFTFAQMIALAVTAAFIGGVPGDGAAGFALAYAANSVILAIMWFRTGYHDRAHRSGAYPFSVLYLLGGLTFAASAFTSVPATYWLWGVGVALQWSAAVPALRTMRAQLGGRIATPSLVERFGLLVILVLGEVVAGAINGMADHRPISGAAVLAGSLGVVVAASLWWLYFELVSARMHRAERGLGWLYGHLPLIMGIIGAGGAVRAVIDESGEPPAAATRWLLVGSVALALAGILVLTRTLALDADQLGTSRTLRRTLLPAAVVILALGFTRWDSVATLVAVTVLSLALVTLSILGWLVRLGAGSPTASVPMIHDGDDTAVSSPDQEPA